LTSQIDCGSGVGIVIVAGHFIKPSSLIDIIFAQQILFIGISKDFLQNLLTQYGF
jgi:hypothetical protein